MFIADYTGHNVLRVLPGTREVTVFAHNPAMNQPNDLAMAPDGTLYASDPNWKTGTGQVWRIDREGGTHREASDLGTTNGIEVSPDGRTVYVNESVQRRLWVFGSGSRRKSPKPPSPEDVSDHGFDGMRCDVDGNLYITRPGKGHGGQGVADRRGAARHRRARGAPQQPFASADPTGAPCTSPRRRRSGS